VGSALDWNDSIEPSESEKRTSRSPLVMVTEVLAYDTTMPGIAAVSQLGASIGRLKLTDTLSNERSRCGSIKYAMAPIGGTFASKYSTN